MAPPPVDITNVTGNAPDKIKTILSDLRFFGYKLDDQGRHNLFGGDVFAAMWLSEVSYSAMSEEPTRDEARAVFGLVVGDPMLNGGMTLHGGCSAFLVDLGTTLALASYALMYPNKAALHTVSQSLTTSYHYPAVKGEELKIVSTTTSVGLKTMSARTEIWSVTKKRLVASGTQNKIAPETPHVEAQKL